MEMPVDRPRNFTDLESSRESPTPPDRDGLYSGEPLQTAGHGLATQVQSERHLSSQRQKRKDGSVASGRALGGSGAATPLFGRQKGAFDSAIVALQDNLAPSCTLDRYPIPL